MSSGRKRTYRWPDDTEPDPESDGDDGWVVWVVIILLCLILAVAIGVALEGGIL